MLGVTDYGAFVIAIIVFLLIPGPGNLALITSTSKGGIRGGLAATFGVILGDQVLMWLAVAGVAALLGTYLLLLIGHGRPVVALRLGRGDVLHSHDQTFSTSGLPSRPCGMNISTMISTVKAATSLYSTVK